MCGFFGIITDRDDAKIGDILIKAGERLSYRGYDSTGIAVFRKDGKYRIKKDRGSVDAVAKRMNFSAMKGYKGIIQLRWATYGRPSKVNAQPHNDCTGNYVTAHNGNIINTHSLFVELKKKGHQMKSENDGEIIAHIMEESLAKRSDVKTAVDEAYRRIKGDYAFVFTEKASSSMTAVKKGSSLFAGIGKGFACVSSDLYAVLDHTDNILMLNDGEMITFSIKGYEIIDLKTGKKVDRKPAFNDIEPTSVYKEPYDSFMEKEIHEVPVRVQTLLDYYTGSNELERLARIINRKRLIITGSGTSYNAALLGTYFLNRIASMDVSIYLPSDISGRLRYVHNGRSNLLAVSQSGETKDIKNAMDSFKTYSKGKIIGMINNMASTIAMTADFTLPTLSDMEVSVPATKTFINQATLFYIISQYLSLKAIDIKANVENLVSVLKKVLKGSNGHEKVIDMLSKRKFFHILGYSMTLPVAMEGALKMKEVNYVNVEAMHSSEFKHGPLALITKNYPVVIVASKYDKHYILSHINELKTRSAYIITITQKDADLKKNSDYNIVIDTEDENIFAIASVYMLQILSMKIAYKKGINPDMPRNISKTITVD